MIDLTNVTHTTEGCEVIDLIYNERGNYIAGRVKCPYNGNKNVHNGFIGCAWNKKGTPLHRYGGKDRTDLKLKGL